MKLLLDVQYKENVGYAAAIAFVDWTDGTQHAELTEKHDGLNPYMPGEFYKRELPCILPLIKKAIATHKIDTLVIDGYVDIDDGKPGLGRYLHDACGIRVVGIAKNYYPSSTAIEVVRGTSKRPLYITATSNVESAARAVESMHGDNRLPTLVKTVDHLARKDAKETI